MPIAGREIRQSRRVGALPRLPRTKYVRATRGVIGPVEFDDDKLGECVEIWSFVLLGKRRPRGQMLVIKGRNWRHAENLLIRWLRRAKAVEISEAEDLRIRRSSPPACEICPTCGGTGCDSCEGSGYLDGIESAAIRVRDGRASESDVALVRSESTILRHEYGGKYRELVGQVGTTAGGPPARRG